MGIRHSESKLLCLSKLMLNATFSILTPNMMADKCVRVCWLLAPGHNALSWASRPPMAPLQVKRKREARGETNP